MRKLTITLATLLCVCIYGMFITNVNNSEILGESVSHSLEEFSDMYFRGIDEEAKIVDLFDKESVEALLEECSDCGISEEESVVVTTTKVTTTKRPQITTTSRPITTSKPITTTRPITTTKPVTTSLPVTTTTPSTTTVTTTNSVQSSVTSMAKEIFELVNERRAEVGKKAYILDEELCSIANMRAKELVSKFSHTRPSGKSFSTALSEAGYGYISVSENIAYGYSSAASVMSKWMSSSAHKSNILDSKNIGYSKIGIGYYNSNGTKYYVQIFVK